MNEPHSASKPTGKAGGAPRAKASRLPLTLGLIGFVVTLVLWGVWWYADTHNVFERVYWHTATSSGFYTPGFNRLQRVTLLLSPFSIALRSPEHTSRLSITTTWVISAFLNFVVYFGVGLACLRLARGPRARRR
jgi:hypothetical protein